MTKLLSRAEILKSNDLPTREVHVPEWNGTVRIRSLTARDRDEIDTALYTAQKEGRPAPENIRALYVAACVVDESGTRIFNDEDVMALGQKNGTAIDRIYTAIMELNKLKPEDIEEAAKN